MKPFASNLTSPAGLDRQVDLDEASVARFRSAFQALERASISDALLRDTCWACTPGLQGEVDFVLLLGSNAEWLIYIVPPFAIRGTEVRRVTAQFYESLVSMVAAAPSRTIDLRLFSHRCTHIHIPFIPRCNCGSPDDFTVWASAEVCLHSNCYNFAVRDVWCSDGQGAQPAAIPSPVNDPRGWAQVLEPDGLYHVPNFPQVPAHIHTLTGWHVALAIDADSSTPYHFLRLDGDSWTHKFGKRPPQRCDTSGRPMPKSALAQADMCGYDVLTYFWAPRPLRIERGRLRS